jgi:hypothetical protein
MRTSLPWLLAMAVALTPVAPVDARGAGKSVGHHKRDRQVARGINDQAQGQMVCGKQGCRPVAAGCHREHEFGGFNGEFCGTNTWQH